MKTLKDDSQLTNLDWIEIRNRIQGFATSGAGKILISQMGPLENAAAAAQSFAEIEAAGSILSSGVRPFMESLDFYESWSNRVKKKAVLKTLEIKDIRSFCLEVLALDETLSSVDNILTREHGKRLMKASEPLSAIDQVMTPRGEIRSDASETLFRLFREKENLQQQVQSTLDRLVKDHDMENLLQDKYVTTREGRWVLPVKGGMQHYMPGVIHGSSQTKQTVFMEPEKVVPLNNRLRQVEVEIEDEIERILEQLSGYLWGLAWDFEKSREILLHLDQLLAKAQLTQHLKGQSIGFSENEILLNDVRHPLLVLAGKDVIPNSVLLNSEKRILLLSGPNAGGKTVLLKSIGITAQMARCGLPPAVGVGSKIPFFKNIHVSIGDAQNVGAELSTFAAHLLLLNRASQLKGPENLILVDEICGSTDPEEGSALARSFIESFIAQKSFAVLTSHLSPLKMGWKPTDPLLNGSLEYDLEKGRPTYQFLQGIPGDSLALLTAKRVGIAAPIVERAVDLLSPASKARLEQLEQIDQMKSDLSLLREQLHKDQQRAKNDQAKYEKLLENFEKEKESMLGKIRKETERKIEEMVSAARAEQTFKKHLSLQEIKSQLPEIIKSKPQASDGGTGVESAEDFAQKFPPGTKVYVPTLGQDGIVQGTPNSKGEVLILAGSIRLNLSWKDLKTAQKVGNPTAQLVRRSGTTSVALNDADKTLDLRGKTVDEALGELEIHLDQAFTRKEDRLKVIHGHGTETLKKAVRTYLSRSSYIKKWKAGTPEQGGDGITWVELQFD